MEEQQGSNLAEPSKEGLSQNKKIAIGCGGVSVVIVCACMLSSIIFFSQFAGEPENLIVEAEYPWTVQEDDTFELILNLQNKGDAAITVGDIDLDEVLGGSILDGAAVERTEPAMEKDYSLSGIKSFSYDRTIPAGESQKVTFYLRATEVGEFGGSIGVYVGDIARRIDVSITVISK